MALLFDRVRTGEAVMMARLPVVICAVASLLLLNGCQSGQPASTPRGIDAPYAYCAATYDPSSEEFNDCWRRQLGRGNDACKALLDSAGKPGATSNEKFTVYARMRELQC